MTEPKQNRYWDGSKFVPAKNASNNEDVSKPARRTTKVADTSIAEQVLGLIHMAGCQAQANGFNAAKSGKDADLEWVEDMEEKLTAELLALITARETATRKEEADALVEYLEAYGKEEVWDWALRRQMEFQELKRNPETSTNNNGLGGDKSPDVTPKDKE